MSQSKNGHFVAALALLFLTVPCMLLDGWVLAKAWNWFVPELFGLRSLGWLQAMALATVAAGFTRHHFSTSKAQEDESASEFFGRVLGDMFGPALGLLLAAWICHLLW